MAEIDREKVEQAVRMILEGIGDDPDRAGLVDTPRRVADMFGERFATKTFFRATAGADRPPAVQF